MDVVKLLKPTHLLNAEPEIASWWVSTEGG